MKLPLLSPVKRSSRETQTPVGFKLDRALVVRLDELAGESRCSRVEVLRAILTQKLDGEDISARRDRPIFWCFGWKVGQQKICYCCGGAIVVSLRTPFVTARRQGLTVNYPLHDLCASGMGVSLPEFSAKLTHAHLSSRG